MDAKTDNYTEFSWAVFLDSLSKRAKQSPDSETTKQLKKEWGPYLKLATETIQ